MHNIIAIIQSIRKWLRNILLSKIIEGPTIETIPAKNDVKNFLKVTKWFFLIRCTSLQCDPSMTSM